MKKYLKIIVTILILIAIGFGLYYFFKKSPVAQDFLGGIFPGTFKTGEKTGVQPIAGEKLQALTQDPIFDYWINSKTGNIYYLTPVGQIIRVSGGQEELVNSQTLNRLNQLTASPDGTSATAKFSYPDFPTFSIFDTVANAWHPLPAGTLAAAWSPTASEIAYLDNKALKILNLVNQKTAEVLKLTQKEAELYWRPDSKILLTNGLLSSELESQIWSINPANKTITPLLSEVGLAVKWSLDGKFGIRLKSVNRAPLLGLIDENGQTLAELTFVTLPSKCLIREKKIYCAVPKNLPERVNLPEDYYKKAVYFEDNFYLIDLNTGGVSTIFSPDSPIDAEHLELDGDRLLFKNRLDEKLYQLTL
ncbi:MAG: hypothetical protein HYY86_01515 [Candidatus Harrisonbacteria bacterium]|nr:hypothetical protein [Candidatus Harrisonbacteria bacterium]